MALPRGLHTLLDLPPNPTTTIPPTFLVTHARDRHSRISVIRVALHSSGLGRIVMCAASKRVTGMRNGVLGPHLRMVVASTDNLFDGVAEGKQSIHPVRGLMQ